MTNDKFLYEEEILKFWEEKDIYNKVQKKNEGNELYTHVDGPPFPTGEVHMGLLRNWATKDSVLRFKRLHGYDVYARDGYDVHGLPVENKVQTKLNLKTVEDLKKFGEENFVKECKEYVKEIVNDMSTVRTRYGLWMNREQYQTSHPEYLSMAWRFFKKAQEKGQLYKDYKTVAWCPNDETTLSDYEIKDTYKNVDDPSIYIKFPLKKEYRTTNYEESFVIWTTTPWTLQSNMAIAMHPQLEYSKVLVELNGKKEVLITANALIEKVVEILSKQNEIKFLEVLETKVGAEYEGIKYDHIYLDDTPSQQEFVKLDNKHIHGIVLADFVTLGEGEDIFDKLEKKSYKHSNKQEGTVSEEKIQQKGKSEGSGLVHIAPGHGFDDYEVGKKYNLPIFCPVGPNGCFTEGKYDKQYFKDVDPIAIDYLKEKGFLLSSAMKNHRYPCCWRCKTPIVYRAADQWWIKRGDYTKDVIKANKNVHWTPNSARHSFDNLQEGAGDWAISRQRYWGIPLPIFEDEDGNYEVFGSKEELEERIGKTLNDIHRDDLKNIVIINKVSGKEMRSVPFIADVWFDSGCASFASHYNEGLDFNQIIEKYYPMNWITEGEDQVRGWFSSLFNVGYMITGKAPYNQVLFQGFVMDSEGKQKMSKSLGNGVGGNEAIDLWGADVTRYYLLSKKVPEEKFNFDRNEVTIVEGFFNTLDNVIKYMNVYLEEHEVRHPSLNISALDVEDKWILYSLNRTIQRFTSLFEKFKLSQAYKELEDFIVRDLSKTYLKLVKDRTEERDENLHIIFKEIIKTILILLSTATPFRAENLYKQTNLPNKKESIFLEHYPTVDELLIKEVESKGIDKNFELSQEIIQSVLNAREKAKIGVRWPLPQIDIISSKPLGENLKVFENLMKKLTNIPKINYDLNDVEINYIIKPNFAKLKQDFDNVQDAIKAINLSKHYISEDLKLGEIGGTYEGVKLDFEKHILKEIELKGEYTSSDFSNGSVILHTRQDEILLEEGYLREAIRRIQSLRKDLSLNKKDEIELSFSGSDEYFLELSQNWGSLISKKVGASNILQNAFENSQEFEIKGKKLTISIKSQ
ncbi:MAG: isoleucine--tRNA ligase [Candidatus Woesearchaeota archaeon]|jgi:isoleucyl-tRNA synthetase|nr:isoleucine--tRNA ligase [Candidatus Woesearchaeota archaeon]